MGTILKVDLRTEYPDRSTFDTRLYISSAALDIERLANGVRGHWGVETMLPCIRAAHSCKQQANKEIAALHSSLVRPKDVKVPARGNDPYHPWH
jgi:hypothetical protein